MSKQTDEKDGKFKRTTLLIPSDTMDLLRRTVVHAQCSGDPSRTMTGTIDDGIQLIIAKLAKKDGEPPKKEVQLRRGARVRL